MTQKLEIKINSYSVIYSIDGENTEPYEPENLELWTKTEDGESDFDIPNWKHKKFIAILNQDQFDQFVENQGLYAEDVETMGAVGSPGHGFAWVPTISFNGTDPDAYQNAYVTPNIPMQEGKRLEEIVGKENVWSTVRGHIIKKYGLQE